MPMNETCWTDLFNQTPQIPKSFIQNLYDWGGLPGVIVVYAGIFVLLCIGSYYFLRMIREENEEKKGKE